MHRGRYIAIALVALLVAVAMPVAAVAQSAGDDQYTDPLQGGGSGSSGGGGGSSGGGSGSGGGGGGGGGDAPATQAQADTDTAPTQATPAQADTSDDDGLPRTGFPVAVLIGAGLILMSGGLALRRLD